MAETATGRSLPSGRHHLTREQVVASQRARMLKAMRESMMERGYVGTSVTDIVRRAGVSRETFYQQFSSKQDCFVQGLDEAMELLTSLLEAARDEGADRGGDPHERFRALLRLYLHALAAEPALARLFLVEVYAAGPEAMARRTHNQERFADAIAALFDATTDEQRFACLALVAAAAQLVTAKLVAGDVDGLTALEEPLAGLARRLFP
ncbi:TetR/AcrR family transcriptional regulator [Thermoactinospora rubra]|uniref:TetR/AcrR family transcriptional regulator n=1 Tax=Thermoactinospora rubra TaxID=1088767 RepID=UPI000A102FDE|nr:TetR family transcriptional regulator [Thermoactinospora rubra]